MFDYLNYLNYLNYRGDRGADGLVKVTSVQFYFSFLFSAGCCDEVARLSGHRGPDKVTCAPHPILFFWYCRCARLTRFSGVCRNTRIGKLGTGIQGTFFGKEG